MVNRQQDKVATTAGSEMHLSYQEEIQNALTKNEQKEARTPTNKSLELVNAAITLHDRNQAEETLQKDVALWTSNRDLMMIKLDQYEPNSTVANPQFKKSRWDSPSPVGSPPAPAHTTKCGESCQHPNVSNRLFCSPSRVKLVSVTPKSVASAPKSTSSELPIGQYSSSGEATKAGQDDIIQHLFPAGEPESLEGARFFFEWKLKFQKRS